LLPHQSENTLQILTCPENCKLYFDRKEICLLAEGSQQQQIESLQIQRCWQEDIIVGSNNEKIVARSVWPMILFTALIYELVSASATANRRKQHIKLEIVTRALRE
jgi:hypothetical protein